MLMTKVKRQIVRIDEAKCNGCGDCVPSCAEGAIRIVNGKARLVAENLCDGLGACLGHCPQGAILVEERAADEYDEAAVERHLGHKPDHSHRPAPPPSAASAPLHAHDHAGGCPGSRMRILQRPAPVPAAPQTPAESRQSQLGQWPVQLTLVPPTGPMWNNADVLIAADCVPFAYPEFHERMLAGKTLAIACPKLDDVRPYVQKLAMIFANNPIKSITVAHMEVPCCTGIVRVVEAALQQAGRGDIPLHDVVVGIDGQLR
jgi:NAD-dependent dihydropyrimidine dehydrogenase PreA subunit